MSVEGDLIAAKKAPEDILEGVKGAPLTAEEVARTRSECADLPRHFRRREE